MQKIDSCSRDPQTPKKVYAARCQVLAPKSYANASLPDAESHKVIWHLSMILSVSGDVKGANSGHGRIRPRERPGDTSLPKAPISSTALFSRRLSTLPLSPRYHYFSTRVFSGSHLISLSTKTIITMSTSIPSPNMSIPTEPLTAESFAPFGTIITAPLPASTTTIPYPPPPNAAYANQNTALKYTNIAPISSMYRLSPSGVPAHPTMSLFSCFPRQLRSSKDQKIFDVRILERHPFTTQTFAPLASQVPINAKLVVIVAPTLPSPPPPSALTPYFPQSRQGGPPDLRGVKAYVTDPGMGVTYGVGTWHAPMVVVGDSRVDFVVTQWISGREGEDCQEIDLSEGLEVVVGDNKSIGSAREKARL